MLKDSWRFGNTSFLNIFLGAKELLRLIPIRSLTCRFPSKAERIYSFLLSSLRDSLNLYVCSVSLPRQEGTGSNSQGNACTTFGKTAILAPSRRTGPSRARLSDDVNRRPVRAYRFELDFTLEERWGCSSPLLPRSLLEKSSMIKIQIGLASYCWTWVHRWQVKFPSVDGKTNVSLPGSVKASFTLRERAAPSSWSGRDQRLSSRLCASDTREFHP